MRQKISSWLKVTLTLIATLASGAAAYGQEMELLSKADARAIFAMTRDQWTENVERAVASGAAKATGTPESGLTMRTTTQGGELWVRPDYSGEGRPDFIQVTAAYLPATAALLSDAMLNAVIEVAAQQMKPEYEVLGNIQRIQGGVAVFFRIQEKDRLH